MSKRKVQLNLVKGDERSLPNLADVRGLMEGLSAQEQELVIEETREFYRARQAGMMSFLDMGQHLAKVRDVLEPKKLWKRYAGSLPNMGIASAYRMIWAWENAQRVLPAATLRVAARDGYRIIEAVKDGGFKPDVERAIKDVTKELGPAPESEKEAEDWLRAVVKRKRQLSKPVDAQRVGVVGQARRVTGLFKRLLARLPEGKRAAFAQRVIDELMSAASVRKAPTSVAA